MPLNARALTIPNLPTERQKDLFLLCGLVQIFATRWNFHSLDGFIEDKLFADLTGGWPEADDAEATATASMKSAEQEAYGMNRRAMPVGTFGCAGSAHLSSLIICYHVCPSGALFVLVFLQKHTVLLDRL